MSSSPLASAAARGASAPDGLEARTWAALAEVLDPEIPAVSVVDMGMVGGVEVRGGDVKVTILPTFTGCPAVDVIRADVERAVSKVPGIATVEVGFSFDPPWTSDRITVEGRRKLRGFGLAPPAGGPTPLLEIGLPKVATCPFCGSKDTRAESPFGPTPCRALYYCAGCRNPFELFKPV